MGKNFSSAETMYGYMEAAANPAVSDIANSLLSQAGNPSAVTPEMVGVIGSAISQSISGMVAQGMSVGDAVAATAMNMGINQGDANAYGVNAAVASVQSAIDTGTPLSSLNQNDVAMFNDPLGGFISSLGVTGTEANTVGGGSTSPDNVDVGGGWSPAGDTSSSTSSDAGYSGVDYGNSGWGTDYGGGYDSYGADTSTSSSGGDSGGSSKIVCTAMNEAYGFGSFRNRIWLKYAQDNLTKAHEVGYHTMFLPLVDLGYKKDVKFVRKALEHIARHRSADLRAEMRGTKRDNLGRMYRFVLEPLCYVVGKLKGY